MPEIACKDCGSINRIPDAWVDMRRPRSRKHHNKFFAVIDAAYYHWPDNKEPFPDSSEHLRAWLLCEAGHCDVISETFSDEGDTTRAVDFTTRILFKVRFAGGGYAFAQESGRRNLLAKIPRTINCRIVDQEEFNPISKKVFEIIEIETGKPIDELIRHSPEYSA